LVKKHLKNYIKLPLPDGYIVEYKDKIVYAISYLYLIGSVSILAGVR
jgi:hypothetical protein